MIQRKVVYSELARNKRVKIKRNIKERFGKERADKFSKHISQTLVSGIIFCWRGHRCCSFCDKFLERIGKYQILCMIQTGSDKSGVSC